MSSANDEIAAAEDAWRTSLAEHQRVWKTYADLCKQANQCLSVGCRETRDPDSIECAEHGKREWGDCPD